MICPAVISTYHGSCDGHVTAVPGSYNDKVNKMPLFRAWVSPRCLVFVSLTKQSVGDGKIVLSTFGEKQNSIGVDVTNAFLSYCALPDVLIPADPGIKVTQENNLIRLGDSGQCLI